MRDDESVAREIIPERQTIRIIPVKYPSSGLLFSVFPCGMILIELTFDRQRSGSWYSRALLMVLTGPAHGLTGPTHGTHGPGPRGPTGVGIKNKGDYDVLFTMKDPPFSLERSFFIA